MKLQNRLWQRVGTKLFSFFGPSSRVWNPDPSSIRCLWLCSLNQPELTKVLIYCVHNLVSISFMSINNHSIKHLLRTFEEWYVILKVSYIRKAPACINFREISFFLVDKPDCKASYLIFPCSYNNQRTYRLSQRSWQYKSYGHQNANT